MQKQVTIEQIVGNATDGLKRAVYVRMPGAVTAYDPETQTATVQPMVNDVRFDVDTGAIVYEPWQPIQNVPVAWPRFGAPPKTYVIAGFLSPQDQVTLEAFDLDISAWRAQGRSQNPVNPADARKLGGNYWSATPTDLTGPIDDPDVQGGASLVLGLAGGATIVVSGTDMQLGAKAETIEIGTVAATKIAIAPNAMMAVARGPNPLIPTSVGDTVNAGYLVFLTSSPLALGTPPYYPGTPAGLAAAQAAVMAGAPNAFMVSLTNGTIASGSTIVTCG